MQKVSKAVVLTAGLGLRSLPATKTVPKALLAVFDRPAVQWVCEEAAASGAKEILLVISPDSPVRKHFETNSALERMLAEQNRLGALASLRTLSRLNVRFAVQEKALGSGDALLTAKSFVGDKPFFLLNCDDLFLGDTPACKTLSDSYAVTGLSTVGCVQRKHGLEKYGVLRTKPRDDGELTLVEIEEKPTHPASDMIAAGRYLFTPLVFEVLERTPPFGEELRLSDALALMCRMDTVCAKQIPAKRFDTGNAVGLAAANTAYAYRYAKKEFLDEISEADFFK